MNRRFKVTYWDSIYPYGVKCAIYAAQHVYDAMMRVTVPYENIIEITSVPSIEHEDFS